MVKGCQLFLCSLSGPKQLYKSQAKTIRWHLFKQLKPDQGVEKLPTTLGVWLEHILVWSQDLVVNPLVPDSLWRCYPSRLDFFIYIFLWYFFNNPLVPDPVTLGWQMQDGKLLLLLTKEAPAPEAVLQLIRCNCGSTNVESTNKCSRGCSCKRNNLVCTEMCNCAGDDKCQNTEPIVIGLDNKSQRMTMTEYLCLNITPGPVRDRCVLTRHCE